MMTAKWLTWWSVWMWIHVLRAVLVVQWCAVGSPLGYVLAVVEGLSVAFSVVNVAITRRIDERWLGFVLPVCYVAGFVLLPPMRPLNQGAVWLVWLVALCLVLWGFWSLGKRYTAAFASFHSLCDWGPYRWMRHPQATGRVLVILSVGMSGVNVVSLIQCLLCLGFVWIGMLVEESFLRGSREYLDYCQRVPFRLWPGVL